MPNIGGGDWSILTSVDSKQNVKNSKYESMPESSYQMFILSFSPLCHNVESNGSIGNLS
jgi:hypothetical protein